MYSLTDNGILDFYSQNITSLDELPENAIEIICQYNKLKVIPKLPDSLKRLSCYFNNLTSLPELPEGLEKLLCDHNHIKYLPALPNSLEFLSCYNNPLECLIPEKFIENQYSGWVRNYYYPYISSYEGQNNILTKFPNQCGELMKQVKIHDKIMEKFGYLINSCEMNLI